jgi:hypothetical protein
MKKFSLALFGTYFLPVLVGALIFFVCMYFEKIRLEDVFTFYKTNMRASLFAGFLTMGSFLLSLKTGIVIKIKENVYDKDSYQTRVREAQAEGVSTTFYGPLKRLSKLLSIAVVAALSSAALQLTLGLYSAWWSAAICLSAASMALAFLLVAFALIQANLSTWFDFLEDEASKAKEKR